MELKESVAAKIVGLIYHQTGCHTIACSRDGIIIADSAQTRVGMPHEGARKILNSGEDDYSLTYHGASPVGSFHIAST